MACTPQHSCSFPNFYSIFFRQKIRTSWSLPLPSPGFALPSSAPAKSQPSPQKPGSRSQTWLQHRCLCASKGPDVPYHVHTYLSMNEQKSSAHNHSTFRGKTTSTDLLVFSQHHSKCSVGDSGYFGVIPTDHLSSCKHCLQMHRLQGRKQPVLNSLFWVWLSCHFCCLYRVPLWQRDFKCF